MFSWIIEEKGKIIKINWKIFEISCSFIKKLVLWQSISHDWVCLTVKNISSKSYEVEVMPETLEKTNLWFKKIWDFVNLERSLKIWDRLDGHIVQWHVDTVWTLKKITTVQNSKILEIKFPKKYSKFFVEKWSVTLNGISLTLIKVEKDFFTVWIIPFTLEKTNLSNLKVWDKLNIETDILAKYFIKLNKFWKWN